METFLAMLGLYIELKQMLRERVYIDALIDRFNIRKASLLYINVPVIS